MEREGSETVGAVASEHCPEAPERAEETTSGQEQQQQRTLKRPTGVTSAAAVAPPPELWPSIQAIREKHDRAYVRWLPHINLIYPFVHDEFFVEAAPALTKALADFKPFKLRFDSFSHFHRSSSNTLWLKPVTEPPEALLDLQDLVESVFPYCNAQSHKSPNGFTPHLTVGTFKTQARTLTRSLAHRCLPELISCRHVDTQQKETLAVQEQLQASWTPIEFVVKEIYLISRTKDTPFEIRHVIPFASASGEDYGAPHFETHPVPEKEILPPSTTRVHVGNIPLQLTDEQLGALFTDKGFRVVSASVAMDRRGKKNRGFGFVEFATEEETESAKASLNCTLVGTRKITVSATQ